MENEKCQELANIEYQNMLLNGVKKSDNKNKEQIGTIENMEDFLEKEKMYESKLPWGKLNKTKKYQKISEYIEDFSINNTVSETNKIELLALVKIALNRKKLQRIKDVIYNKETGIIKNIPAFEYDKKNHVLFLKNTEKKQSTLKSLAPKKIDGKKMRKQKTQKKGSPKHNISMKIKGSPKSKNLKILEEKNNLISNKHYVSPRNSKIKN